MYEEKSLKYILKYTLVFIFMTLDSLDPLDLIQPFCLGRAKSRCGGVLAVNFHDFYRQHLSGFHAYKAKIMPKLFILISFISFVAYLISGAHCVKFGRFGRNLGRPAALWSFRLKLHLHVYKYKSKQS
jgi:hypothetical protein